MATINGLYIFVKDEDVSYGVEVTEHTVESGIAISDHVKRSAVMLSINGEIVGKNADSVLSQVKKMHQGGTLCKYVGRTSLSNCLITDFSTTQTASIWGGYSFTMTLKEIRTASTSYKATKGTTKSGTQQINPKSNETYVYHTVKKGDCVWDLVVASNAPYKNLNRPAINGKSYSDCNWVMAMNQSAFSRKGDFRTLQIGKKIIVGLRKTATSSKAKSKGTGKFTMVSLS